MRGASVMATLPGAFCLCASAATSTPLPQIPLYGLESHRGCWRNLSVDLAGLTLACFRADAFKTLDTLAVGPTCRVRKIFTMRGALHVFDQHSGEL